MADISVLLDNIMHAVKGEDVRGSIHDAIEQCYTDGNWNATTGMVDLEARRKIDEFINNGTGYKNEVQIYPAENSDLTVYCETSFRLEEDPSNYDVIRVYYKVVSSATPQIFEFSASDFVNSPSVIAAGYFEKPQNPATLTYRRINIRHVPNASDPKSYEAYNVGRWTWNGTVTDTENGTNNAKSYTVDGASIIGDDRPAGEIVKITGIKYLGVEQYVSDAVDEYIQDHNIGWEDGSITTAKLADGAVTAAKLDPNIDLGVADGSITRSKIADHAVSFNKTDFYYQGSLSQNYTWVEKRFYTNAHRLAIYWSQMSTILNEFPETLSIVMSGVTAGSVNWYQGSPTDMRLATTNHNQVISRTNKTFTVNGVNYGVIEIKRSDFETAYNALKTYVEDSGESWTDYTCVITNVAARIPTDGDIWYIAGEVTSELIELGFSTTIISPAFVSAVQAAMSGGGSSEATSYDEELAKARLTGKVMINIGDSYTSNMGSLLNTLATKYGMVRDNQGQTNTKIIDHFQSRVNNLVTDYTAGKTLSGTTYHASDVAIITFMGGANDGGGITTFVGDGLHVTDTTKIYGACHYIFKTLLNTFTNAKLIVIAQPANYNQSVSNFTAESQATALGFTSLAELQRMDDYQLSEYIMWNKEKAVLDVAKAYSLPTIDAFTNFPTMLNPANRTAYWSDSIHINTAGSAIIVNWLDKKILELTVG